MSILAYPALFRLNRKGRRPLGKSHDLTSPESP